MTDHLPARLDRWRTMTLADLPDEVVTTARHCLLDWAGCALAGSQEPLATILTTELVAEGGLEKGATLVGRSQQVTARVAALANGAAGHALDYDDTNLRMNGHPTAPVLPAVLALGEELDGTGEALLTALVAGIEVECRVAAVLGTTHYEAGWHATGTLGTFGAAAAAGRLIGLDPAQWGHALGLAGTVTAGLKASFGTMAKPLHAGQAAANGLLAARLAGHGFTGNPAVVEANQGFAAASGSGLADLDVLDRLEDEWLIRQTLFKYHAACYLTHASINAATSLRPQLDIGAIDAIEVRVAPTSLDVCAIPAPRTGLEGKFSLRATTAMALLGDDTSDPVAYSDRRVGDPSLVALRDRVKVVPDATLRATRSVVTITMDDGRRLVASADTGQPSTDLGEQERRLVAKFRALAAPVAGEGSTSAIVDAVVGSAPPSWTARQLAALLARPPSGADER